jgi:hypothetical protein
MKDAAHTISVLLAARDALADAVQCFESAEQNQLLDDSKRVIRERIDWYRNTHAGVCAEINALRSDVR